jgi:prevent-host-death family protein
MREIGAFEAKNTLGTLLDLVQQGEQVVITRHGKPVARLVPEIATRDSSAAKAAVERIRARARARMRTSGPITVEEWTGFRDEGRA